MNILGNVWLCLCDFVDVRNIYINEIDSYCDFFILMKLYKYDCIFFGIFMYRFECIDISVVEV